jgi:4-hydroxybenzoate polyprenyltransferase/phosphoserine phosphatase
MDDLADDLASDIGRGSIPPLVVDLDGTLIRSDILAEGVFAHIGSKLTGAIELAQALRGGKASLKHFLAHEKDLNTADLPYDPQVLALIAEAKSDGRKVYLATASHQRQADAVANNLRLFDGVFATNRDHNLSGANKAQVLQQAFGSGNFDYVGNDFADLEVWKHARMAYVVGPNRRLARRVQMLGIPHRTLPRNRPSARTWATALRVHQYAKNTLLFVPALTSHTFEPEKLLLVLLGFLIFSAAASAVYLLNDLIDIDADRSHPTKRHRPFANGSLPWKDGVTAIGVMTIGALALSLALSPKFTGVLIAYIVVTTSYTLLLKRKMLIDVVVLAMLYTVRVVAGGVLIDAEISEWLLAFSLLIFTSLAIIKRYVELSKRLSDGLPDLKNRNYRTSDLPILAALAAATAANAVTIFALYISSRTVAAMYSRPLFLWLICPLLIYFLGRALMLAHRGEMHDDPIVFALTDPVSRATVVSCGLLVLLAI